MFKFNYILPHVSLRKIVKYYYLFTGEPGFLHQLRDTIVPNGVSLRAQIKGAAVAYYPDGRVRSIPPILLSGPQNQPADFVLYGNFTIFGIEFQAAGWHILFQSGVDEFTDNSIDLYDFIGFEAYALLERLRNSIGPADMVAHADRFVAQYCTNDKFMPLAVAINQLLQPDSQHSIASAASQLGLSLRSLERWSLRLYGNSPKMHQRRLRILQSLQRIRHSPNRPWTEHVGIWAYDQAHYIREFKNFVGQTPGQFSRRQSQLDRKALIALDAMFEEGREAASVIISS
jgi:AraC-like DNA-binding protein